MAAKDYLAGGVLAVGYGQRVQLSAASLKFGDKWTALASKIMLYRNFKFRAAVCGLGMPFGGSEVINVDKEGEVDYHAFYQPCRSTTTIACSTTTYSCMLHLIAQQRAALLYCKIAVR